MSKRTPERTRPKLGDSWVVESDEERGTPPSESVTTNSSSETPRPTPPHAAVQEEATSSPVEGDKTQNRSSQLQPREDNVADDVGNDQGQQHESPPRSMTTSSWSSDSVPASPRQLPREVEPAFSPRTRSARRHFDESTDPLYVESTDDGNTSPSELKSSRIKESAKLRRSQRLGASSKISRRMSTRANTKISVEPELIMPSIHEDGLGGSWAAAEKPRRRSNRASRGSSSVPVRADENRTDNPRSKNASLPFIKEEQPTALNHAAIFLKHLSVFVYDVAGGAFGKIKTPLSYLLAIYLLVGLMILLRNVLTSSLYSALSPICRLPGSSVLALPMCRPHSAPSVSDSNQPAPVQFDRLMNVQSQFEAVLEESAGGVSLPFDMKRGESSIRDLRQVVRYSGLHSKNELVLEFDGFIETARIASSDLQKFNSHVGRGVDNVLATARWTKRVLDGIALRDGSRGAIVSFFNDRLLAPFQPLRFTEDALLDQYIQHTRIVEKEIHRLIAEAQALLGVLQNLEDRLDVIHGIAVRDDLHAQSSRAEILSQLWTKVGGNRSKLDKFNSELRLLSHVNTYRQNAIAHVSRTMIKLQGMGAELVELRERVGGVELLGGNMGVPLSVHIENIELGVQRLETGRNRAKELEGEELQRTLDRGKKGFMEVDGGG